MQNLHLLQITLTVAEVRALEDGFYSRHPEPYFAKLPTYMIARCPYCHEANYEGLNTYSLKHWALGYGKWLFDPRAGLHHCEHFVLVQPFINFHGIWPVEARGQFGPEVPDVIGHLLESGMCVAEIHALPICRIEDNAFVPRYTLFMVSYFSEHPTEAYEAAKNFSLDYVEPGVIWLFVGPPPGKEQWRDLAHWVAAKQLFWIDGSDASLPLRTGDVDNFPYSNVKGRIEPYLHIYPYPIQQPRRIDLSTNKSHKAKQ